MLLDSRRASVSRPLSSAKPQYPRVREKAQAKCGQGNSSAEERTPESLARTWILKEAGSKSRIETKAQEDGGCDQKGEGVQSQAK